MARTARIAVLQAAFERDIAANIAKIEAMIRNAAADGAQIILTPELLQGPYFCKTEEARHFAGAYPFAEHPVVLKLAPLAAELGVVLPLSIFERAGEEYFNSLVMIDADGKTLGLYRKSHIPDGPGYEEKFYFRPGDTGFKVWDTQYARIGVGICWDQWFPEAARIMTLMGAELLFYPTAIGSEPQERTLNTSAAWRRAMQGHAISNIIPVAAANRVGNEDGQVFYGSSFLTDHMGEIVAELGRKEEGVIAGEYDFEAIRLQRAAWGFFRDRRPELYGRLIGKD